MNFFSFLQSNTEEDETKNTQTMSHEEVKNKERSNCYFVFLEFYVVISSLWMTDPKKENRKPLESKWRWS